MHAQPRSKRCGHEVLSRREHCKVDAVMILQVNGLVSAASNSLNFYSQPTAQWAAFVNNRIRVTYIIGFSLGGEISMSP